ncbi:DUF2264 domain-containing protein [Arthrobacter sp. ISL-30]|nr:DUF2264 domain-containing protein [Arthrobacter sp. ISL-30]
MGQPLGRPVGQPVLKVPGIQLPEPDYQLSPYTGLTREHWAAYADYLLRSVHKYATEDHGNIYLPGAVSAYGKASDSLEAFARSFLLASFRIMGDPQGTGWLTDWYAKGLDAGSDPHSPARWPRPDELGQAKVEAASLAVGLALTREHLWDKLPQRVQEQLVAWFETVIGGDYPPINWVWFQIVVESFLASVGGRYSDEDIDAGLAIHESLYKGGGWFADGPERSYDHYIGWAFHVYPQLWAIMAPSGPRVQARKSMDAERLAAYLDDAACLVGANGSPLIQGRSLIYRFAAAAPFWAGELAGNTRLSPGLSRRAASGMLRYFDRHGAVDSNGLLSIGWHGEFPGMKQSYSGAGSPYWASKGMMGLALPADHPVWTDVEQPLPVEKGDTQRLIGPPGWQVNGTVADGVVRIHNHGTDHARAGDSTTDSPLYARLGYSTHSFPDLEPESLDNACVLMDAQGSLTHRTGFEFLGQAAVGDILLGASVGQAKWIMPDPERGPDHGSGTSGTIAPGPRIGVASVSCAAVEIRIVILSGTAGCQPARLRIGGWPVALGSMALDSAEGEAGDVESLHSSVQPLAGWGHPLEDSGEHLDEQPGPMTNHPSRPGHRIPWVGTLASAEDGVYAAVVSFGGPAAEAAGAAVRWIDDDGEPRLVFGGPDGGETLESGRSRSVTLKRLREEFPGLGL